MEIEQLEVFDFLKTTTPLESVNNENLILLVNITHSLYQKRGAALTLDYNNIYLIHKGAITIENTDEQIVEVLAEKDFFGFNDELLTYTHTTKEDTLFYAFDKQEFFQIFTNNNEVNNFFIQQQKITTQKSNSLLNSSVLAMSKALDVVFVHKDTIIKEIAQIMSATPTTAVLVRDDASKLLGIITDRAFCTKVVAQNLDYNSSAIEIMTPNPITIQYYENGVRAMLKMAKAGVRHLPIEKNNQVVGILTAADLLRKQSHNVVFLLGEINQAKTPFDLAKISKHLPLILTSSVDNNLDEHDIAYSLSTIGRNITTKLIKQFEARFGEHHLSIMLL